MKSRILYSSAWPPRRDFPEESVLFYDSVLDKNADFRVWSRRFRYRLPLKAGENLKTLDSLQAVLNKITAMKVPQTTALTFIAAGGGSVGDFCGFLASIFLRGRALVLLPSTWLAAVDSAHGGKTGLNFRQVKNQLGTFHPAEKIYLVEPLLRTQPAERLREAAGEIIKIALLADARLFAYLEKNISFLEAGTVLARLPALVRLKYKIVARDPQEKNGLRRLLNLGHTLGHVFETHFGWPHGVAVLLGIQFAARWSVHRGLMREADFVRLSLLLENLRVEQDLSAALKEISENRIRSLLVRDKKLTSASALDFIFIRRIGQGVRRKVTLAEILREVKRQKTEF